MDFPLGQSLVMGFWLGAMIQYNDSMKYPVYQTSELFPNSYNSIQLYSQANDTIPPQGDLLDPKLNFHNNETASNKVAKNAFIYAMNPSLQSNISFLAIRAAEYLQRWKEVVQFSSKDYNDQMKAQFG